MRLGLAVLTLTVGAAAAVVWLPGYLAEDELAVVTEVGDGGFARVGVPHTNADGNLDAKGQRFFGSGLTNTKSDNRQPIAPATLPTPPEPKLAVRPALVPASVVTPLPATAPQPDRTRPEVVRDLQRELKRIGCYAGDVDGDWGPGSRRAMQAFLQSVNSTVPTGEPDLIQLTLVRGYRGLACAAQCPPDRVVPGTGRCLPAAVMAARATERIVAERPITDGAITVSPGSVHTTSQIVTGTTAPSPAWAPVVTRLAVPPPAQLPAAIAAAPPTSVRPLDGRMAIGGPAAPVEVIAPPPRYPAVPRPGSRSNALTSRSRALLGASTAAGPRTSSTTELSRAVSNLRPAPRLVKLRPAPRLVKDAFTRQPRAAATRVALPDAAAPGCAARG